MFRAHFASLSLAIALLGVAVGLALGDRTDRSMIGPVAGVAVIGVIAAIEMAWRLAVGLPAAQVVPERVRQALDTLAEGLLVLDERERIVLANRAVAEAAGTDTTSLADLPAGDLPWQNVQDDGAFPWTESIQQSRPRVGVMMRFQPDDKEERIFSVNSSPLGTEGGQRGALVTFRDVTHIEAHRAELEKTLSMLRNSRDEVARKNRELEILATQDALTGCLNRRAFFEQFDRMWEEARRRSDRLACLMIDNDHFKSINDRYGHHVGDEALREVSRVIRERHRGHLVCRYGGEEFCVVLAGVGLDEAVAEAEHTRQAISGIRLKDPADLRLTASVGVSELQLGAANPQELINQADRCLYIAKRRGRNRVVPYDPAFEVNPVEDSATARAAEPRNDDVAIPFQAVTALVSALAYRDGDTAEHSRRVADLCVVAAEGLLDQREIYVLEIAALLHDIGKIGVPDHVLLKPGKLTRDEWKLMRQHDRIGVEIIDGTFRCHALSEIIRTHHAFFGGGGPGGLPSGHQIPLEARLLTIADSYDAMVSDRVYRKGRSHAEAVEELRRCAGTQFDPELVEHFVEKLSHRASGNRTPATNVSKEIALQIGMQIERLATAIDSQDHATLHALAGRLRLVAHRHAIAPIAEAASRIENRAAAEDVPWLELLQQTQELMELCRATQNVYIGKAQPAATGDSP